MKDIFNFYKDDCDESKRLNSQAGKVEFLTTMHYLKKVCNSGFRILDACAGGGVYAFPLAEQGYEVVAGDLVESNVEIIRNKQSILPVLSDIYLGSILDLSQFSDKSFDVVLNLGAYYHLCDKTERMNSIKESLRVLKKGGIYVMAYINRYANYISHCSDMNTDFGFFERYMQNGHIDNEFIFYASTPEMVEEEVSEFNLQQMYNIATDGPIFYYRETVNEMSKEDFERFMKIHLAMCEVRSTLGFSEHGLYIAKKV